MFYDTDKDYRDVAFKENDFGINITERKNIVKNVKEQKGSKLVIRLYPPFQYLLIYQ